MCIFSGYQLLKEKEQIWRTDVSKCQDILDSCDNQDCDGSQRIDDFNHGPEKRAQKEIHINILN